LIGIEINESIEIISIYATERYDYGDDNKGAGIRNVYGVANRNIISTTLTTATNDSGVVTTTWHGDAGETYEYFQVVGTGIGVGWLDMIKTINTRQRYIVCYIGDCEYCDDGVIKITEEEYFDVIHEFGTAGYDVEGEIKAKYINLEWLSIKTEMKK